MALKSKLPETSLLRFGALAFYRMVAQGIIVDGRAGGILVGRTHEEGGIAVIRQRGEEFHLQKARLANGYFILNHHLVIPQWKPSMAGSSGIRAFPQFLNTDSIPDDKILWLTAKQEVITEPIASQYLTELTLINMDQNPYKFCDLEEAFEHRSLYSDVIA